MSHGVDPSLFSWGLAKYCFEAVKQFPSMEVRSAAIALLRSSVVLLRDPRLTTPPQGYQDWPRMIVTNGFRALKESKEVKAGISSLRCMPPIHHLPRPSCDLSAIIFVYHSSAACLFCSYGGTLGFGR